MHKLLDPRVKREDDEKDDIKYMKNDSISKSFDVIVVGGGHAGVEAAYASSKMGCKTLLITLSKEKIGLCPESIYWWSWERSYCF